MRITGKVEGLNKVVQALNSRIKKVDGFTEDALRDIGLDLLGKAVQRAPVDTGDLRGSGFAEMEGSATVIGFTAPYALRQHEELQYQHPQGGEAKYLENPLKENTDKYIKHLAESVRKAVE